MSKKTRNRIAILATTLASVVAVLPASLAVAAEQPIKELRETSIGGAPWGFSYPVSVASGSAPEHYLYVADRSNGRIQVFTAQGVFVSMFGWEVDKSTKGNVCTAASKNECQAGQPVADGPAGQIAEPTSVTVDQKTGDVYVLDWINRRVDKYSATGEFIFTIGGGVNLTADRTAGAGEEQKNICTEKEIETLNVECQGGSESPAGAKTHGEFKFEGERGNLLAVDAKGVLYVGDRGRVQEFEENGKYVHEVPISGTVEALAVDGAEDLYILEMNTIVRKFTVLGQEVKENNWPYIASFREKSGFGLTLRGLAVDPSGRVATTVFEAFSGPPPGFERMVRSFGVLLNGITAQPITEFAAPEVVTGIAFGDVEVSGTGGFDMYLAAREAQQVLAYRPVSVGEPSLTGPAVCTPGVEVEADATFDCSLSGSVNPWGVLHTEAWFEWGETPSLGSETAKQAICATVCGEAPVAVSPPGMIEGLRPNVSRYYRLAGRDENVQAPELLTSETASFTTPIVAPRVVGVPSVSFVHASSAVLFGELNPENASTEYFFEYGPCPDTAACQASPYPDRTAAQQSQSYGTVGSTFEAVGLQPSTVYHYRLVAESENTLKTEKRTSLEGPPAPEGVFESAPAPKVQAETGGVSAVTSTSAVVSGAVDPGGQAAIYTFELGIYNGTGTQYGVVFSGPVAAGVVLVAETLQLTGLQPGTTYAYRLEAQSGYGESTGAPVVFTTAGLPVVLVEPTPLAMLAIPNIAFPAVATPAKPTTVPKKAKGKAKKGKRKKSRAKKATKTGRSRKVNSRL